MQRLCLVSIFLSCSVPCLAILPDGVQTALARVAANVSKKYNCSVSIAVRAGAGAASAADGTPEWGPKVFSS
eukprot:407885-Amphidinium_carterae.1